MLQILRRLPDDLRQPRLLLPHAGLVGFSYCCMMPCVVAGMAAIAQADQFGVRIPGVMVDMGGARILHVRLSLLRDSHCSMLCAALLACVIGVSLTLLRPLWIVISIAGWSLLFAPSHQSPPGTRRGQTDGLSGLTAVYAFVGGGDLMPLGALKTNAGRFSCLPALVYVLLTASDALSQRVADPMERRG